MVFKKLLHIFFFLLFYCNPLLFVNILPIVRKGPKACIRLCRWREDLHTWPESYSSGLLPEPLSQGPQKSERQSHTTLLTEQPPKTKQGPQSTEIQ